MRLLTVQEAADFLRVTQARTYQLLRSGFIPGVRIGRQLRVDESALHQWVARGGHPLPPRAVRRTNASSRIASWGSMMDAGTGA